MSVDAATRTQRSWSAWCVYLAKRALRLEVGVWQSLYRFAFRRPRVPAGATAYGYHQPVLSVLIVIIVMSAVELVVIDVVVHRWSYIRVPLLVLGIWGLTWMLGLLFGFLTRPHAVGPDGIRVRSGAEVDIPLSWDQIESVSVRKQVTDSKAPKLIHGAEGSVLRLAVQHETNVEIRLRRPITAVLPWGKPAVTGLRIYVDDARSFVQQALRHAEGQA